MWSPNGPRTEVVTTYKGAVGSVHRREETGERRKDFTTAVYLGIFLLRSREVRE